MGRRSIYAFNGTSYGTEFDSQRWLSLAPMGFLCFLLSISLHTFALIAIAILLISHSAASIAIYVAIYVPCFLLAVWSLFMTCATDPGSVPLGARPLSAMPLHVPHHLKTACIESSSPQPPTTTTTREGVVDKQEQLLVTPKMRSAEGLNIGDNSDRETSRTDGRSEPFERGGPLTDPFEISDVNQCAKCKNNYKPPRAHHDAVTGRCIVKLDHYCPWVGNAVGALNHKFFFLFLLYTVLLSTTAAILLAIRCLHCNYYIGYLSLKMKGPYNDAYPGCKDPSSFCMTFLFYLIVWFLFFSGAMLFDSIVTICEGTARIARMQIRTGKAAKSDLGPVTEDTHEMFGGNQNTFEWHWLLPLPVEFPSGMKDRIMGFKHERSSGHHFGNGKANEAKVNRAMENVPLGNSLPKLSLPLANGTIDEISDGIPETSDDARHSPTPLSDGNVYSMLG